MRKQDFVNLGIKNPTTYLYQNYDLIDIYQNNNGYYDNAIYYLYKVRK